jgi:hypothetical protein
MRPQPPDQPYRVAVHGLPHFSRKLTALLQDSGWHVPYHSWLTPIGLASRFSDLAQCDLAFSWWGRISMGKFLWTAKNLGKSRIIMLWCGSDALFAGEDFARGKIDPWVVNRVHWAVSPWLADEVRALGVPCKHVQVSFVEPVAPPPLPDKFSVLVYTPTLKKSHLYGLDLILQVARRLPSIEFHLVGLEEGKVPDAPANLKVSQRVDMAHAYENATVLWRPVRHDGLSFMVLEALVRGRHVLYNYPLRGCIQTTSAEATCRELQRLRDLHASHSLSLNEIGHEYVASEYDPGKVRANLLDLWKQVILSPVAELRESSAVPLL